MDLLRTALLVATLLSSLVAGFLFAFAIVAMPGIKSLRDREFLHAFQVMDRVIQNNQPVFILVWLGSVVALLASSLLGIWQLEGSERLLVILAAAIYMLGVQLPTATIHIPMNNELQSQDLDSMSEPALKEAREKFEPRWVKWNLIRTFFATITSILLLVLIIKL